MSQQGGSGNPMVNIPYAYFYGTNMVPGGFQYGKRVNFWCFVKYCSANWELFSLTGTPTIYPQPLGANASSNAQFAKPSYNSGYGSSGYDSLGQSAQGNIA